MYDYDFSNPPSLLENTPLCIIPEEFVQDWKQWLFRPTECPQPNSVDTTLLFCEHDLLLIDPNSTGDMDSLSVVTLTDWEILRALYQTGPVVSIQRSTNGEGYPAFVHEIEVCQGCRTRRCAKIGRPLKSFLTCLKNRLTDYVEAEIAIRIHAPGEPVPAKASTNGASKLGVTQYKSTGGVVTYRKSRRLRNGKSRVQKRRFVIKKSTTVKEIKMMVGFSSPIPQ